MSALTGSMQQKSHAAQKGRNEILKRQQSCRKTAMFYGGAIKKAAKKNENLKKKNK